MTKCPSTSEYINKTWSIQTEFYSAIKSKPLIHTYNMDESQRPYAEWKKPDSKEDMVLFGVLEQAKLTHGGRKQTSGYLELGRVK